MRQECYTRHMNVSVYGVYYNDQDQVLLVKDASSHLWGFPGGSAEANETHFDTLLREFLEETGLTAQGKFTYITHQNDITKHRWFYKIEAIQGDLSIRGNDLDTEGAAYFDAAELSEDALAPGVKQIAVASLHLG